HEVMIEAVENHNPEVIVIDEIGRELEAAAARTIAERGVQLVATAHGRTLENLLLNPTLSDLVGGNESVTLSDEEARRRGTQKTVLERRSPPTFDVLVEIQERDRVAVHADVATAVDALLRGYPLPPEIRTRTDDGEIQIEKPAPTQAVARQARSAGRRGAGSGDAMSGTGPLRASQNYEESRESRREFARDAEAEDNAVQATAVRTVRVFPYGVARNRLMQAAKRLGVPVLVVREVEEADVVMTLRSYYRAREQAIVEAEERGLQIYALRANTIAQMEQSLADLFNLPEDSPLPGDLDNAASQTQNAIQAVLGGQRFVDLPPAAASIRRMQHEMARQAQLVSHSYGKEPFRRVRIFRD
ncbi:AAA family ATPase, partial [bacterium]